MTSAFIAAVRRMQLAGLLVGIVAGLLAAAGWYFDPARFYPAYLVGFLFWIGMALGAQAVVMIHYLTGGGWGIPIRRILEAAIGTLPVLALLFLPLLAGLRELYPWARPDYVASDSILRRQLGGYAKIDYLNVDWFLIRSAIYFAIWIVLGLVLNWLSAGDDPANERWRRRRLALLSGPGMILWALAVTFAAVDWAMSLEPHWFSSMYGVLFMAGQGVSGLALAILIALPLRNAAPWGPSLTVSRVHDVGNLLLAAVLFWSYVSLMQFLIIWSGNLPEETPWYIHRSGGGWQFVAVALAALHFLVPFLLLLMRQTKRDARWLLGVAGLLAVMRLVDLYWLVIPAFRPQRLSIHWLDLVVPLAIGGFALAAFASRLLVRAPLAVCDDPLLETSHA
ncbi:MAG TPA: hypothetical protein VFB96_24365 [Pirellulaceae bacterium]|nr:hypothetical protein [Pirellulaceae bacterium]